MELRGIGTTRRQRLVWAIPPTGPEYQLKCAYLKIRPLDRAQIFSLVSEGCFPWSCVESALPADGVWSWPFHRKTRVPAQKVPIQRSNLGIALKFFLVFSEAGLNGVLWTPYYTLTAFVRGLSTDKTRILAQKVRI